MVLGKVSLKKIYWVKSNSTDSIVIVKFNTVMIKFWNFTAVYVKLCMLFYIYKLIVIYWYYYVQVTSNLIDNIVMVNFIVSHIFKEGNCCAYKLANTLSVSK